VAASKKLTVDSLVSTNKILPARHIAAANPIMQNPVGANPAKTYTIPVTKEDGAEMPGLVKFATKFTAKVNDQLKTIGIKAMVAPAIPQATTIASIDWTKVKTSCTKPTAVFSRFDNGIPSFNF
jgi:hypothetical protein